MRVSSIGKKAIVAVSGLFLFLFVFGHMAGNLQFFAGRESINRYGEFLHAVPELLWLVRFALLALVALHITFTIKLWQENQSARPVGYVGQRYLASTWGSRSMVLSGLMVLLFLVYHLAHFTVMPEVTSHGYAAMVEDKTTGLPANKPGPEQQTEAGREIRPDVYGRMYLGFSYLPISAIYIVAQVLLGLHLSHGATSMFRTLGLWGHRYAPALRRFGPAMATIICLGFVSIPIAVLVDHHLIDGFLFNHGGLVSLGAEGMTTDG